MEKNVKQQPKKKKKDFKPIQKPFLRGTVSSKVAAKRGVKIIGLFVAYMFCFLLLGSSLDFENLFLRLLVNVIAILATISMTYMEGLRDGDSDVAFGEIAWNRKESGKDVDAGDLDRCYHPVKAVFTALVGVAPFFLIALMFAFMAEKQTYSLSVLPNWVLSYTVDEIAQPLAFYQRDVSFGLVDAVRGITRLCLIPYVNIVTVDNASALLMVDRLSPLLMLLPAFGYVLGYWRGPSSRAFTHGSIAANNRRRARKQKREMRARRQQKGEDLI